MTQMKSEDAEEASERIPTKRVATAGSPTKDFRCPDDYDDITTSADKMYNIELDNNVIEDSNYKNQNSGQSFSLRVETRECRCKCATAGGKLCSDDSGKHVLYRSLFRANIANQNGKLSRLCKSSTSSQDQHHCINPKWKKTVFIPLENEAVKKTKAEFKKYFQAKTKSAKGTANRVKCTVPPKSELKKKEEIPTDATWPTSPGHTNALTGTRPGTLIDPGYGALARLSALLQEESNKAGAAMEDSGEFPKCSKGKVHRRRTQAPSGHCTLMVHTLLQDVRQTCEMPTDLPKDSLVINLQHKECSAMACITVKVTKNPKGDPLVKGWSTSTPFTPRGKHKMKNTPKINGVPSISDNCVKWRQSSTWKIAADAIMREAVAKFRFEVGQHLLKKTWFDGGFYPSLGRMGGGAACVKEGKLGYDKSCKDGPATKPNYYMSKSKLLYLCNKKGDQDQGHWGKDMRERQSLPEELRLADSHNPWQSRVGWCTQYWSQKHYKDCLAPECYYIYSFKKKKECFDRITKQHKERKPLCDRRFNSGGFSGGGKIDALW